MSSTPSSETLWDEPPGIRCIPLAERPCHRIRIRSHSDRKPEPTNTPLPSIPWAAVSTLDMVVDIRNRAGLSDCIGKRVTSARTLLGEVVPCPWAHPFM